MDQASKNLRFWQTLVGLPEEFPNLGKLTKDTILEHMVIDPNVKTDIFKALSSQRLTAIIVNEGCGLSTLCRYFVKLAEDEAILAETIPVFIDFGAPQWQNELTPTNLESEIKFQVIRNLVLNPWEQRMDTNHYFKCINFEEDQDFAAFRADRKNFLSFRDRPSTKKFIQKFPFANQLLGDILNYFLQNMRIRTTIFYHFSHIVGNSRVPDGLLPLNSYYEEHAKSVESSIKIMTERSRFLPASIREVYFCTPRTRRDLDRDFNRAFSDIEYDPYSSGEIFAMLVKRYKPTSVGERGEPEHKDLGSVFSERFVKSAWADKRPIREVIKDVRHLILQRLDCDKKDVPYHLEPAESTQDIMPELPEDTIRKFVRKKRSSINDNCEQ